MSSYKKKNVMLSKNQIKRIKSLELKKNREREGLFVAEGPKTVSCLMAAGSPRAIVATESWYMDNGVTPRQADSVVTEDELRKASFLQHPQQVIGIFDIPDADAGPEVCASELCLALDRVQDPGNLGTIIRVADWFGVSTIFCSNDTVDAFSPKVVQATMGSIAHVKIVYTDIVNLIDSLPADVPTYATALGGDDIYRQELSANGLLVMGNEGSGVSPEVMSRVKKSLLIPSYSLSGGIDSLNVAIATAVACAEFKRRLG